MSDRTTHTPDVREAAAKVVSDAIHAALCSRCDPAVGSGLTIRSLDTDRAAPVVLDALLAAGWQLAPPTSGPPLTLAQRDAVVGKLAARFDPHPNEYAPADPAEWSCMTVFVDTDGHNSLRALTYGEIADAICEATPAPEGNDDG